MSWDDKDLLAELDRGNRRPAPAWLKVVIGVVCVILLYFAAWAIAQ